MSAYRLSVSAVVALLASGCLFFHPWATEREVDGSYDQAFQATLETLEARSFPLKRVDRVKGVIETGKRPVDGVVPGRRVETVRAEVEDENGGEASVRLLMTFYKPAPRGGRERRASEAADQSLDRSALYDDYLDAIAARARDLRGDGQS